MNTEEVMRTAVKRFARQMEAELKKNDHKGGWKTSTNHYLLLRCFEEWLELRDVVLSGRGDIRKEAVDVANFAMMIWDNAPRPSSGRRR